MKTLGKAKQKAGMQRVLSESLDSVSLTVVGEDSQLNWAVAQALATRMGWFPVQTSKIVAGLHRDRELTPAEQAAAEAEVLKGLRTQYRVVASCQGGGAASLESTYRDLYGNFIIWIDEGVAGETKPATPERQLYAAKADVPVTLTTKRGFAAPKPPSLDDKAAAAVDRLMPQMVKFLQQRPGLVAKKKEYVKLGCRGDWPDLKPPGWSPIHDALGRDAAATVPL